MKNILRNEKGVALLQALMVSAVVGVVAGTLLSQMRLTDKTLMVPRIRSHLQVAESAFRNLTYLSTTYTCLIDTGGPSSCALNPAFDTRLNDFEKNLPVCTPGPCGIRFGRAYSPITGLDTTTRFIFTNTPAARTLTTFIGYNGTNIKVAPVQVTINIPEHIMTGEPFKCASVDEKTPFFKGFDPGGNAICMGFTSVAGLITNPADNGVDCPPGFYVKSFNPQSMNIACEEMNPQSACAPNQYISQIQWPAVSGAFTFTCANRPNGFTYFGLNLTLGP